MAALGPSVADSFVVWFTADFCHKLNERANLQIAGGDFSMLDVLHHFTSGFKALGTDLCYRASDTIR